MHPSIKRQYDAWQQGYFNFPGRPPYLMDAFERAAYLQGQRTRGGYGETARAGQPKQTLREAVGAAFGLLGAAAGFLFGLYRMGTDQGTWIGLLALTIGGGLAAVIFLEVVSSIFSRIGKSILWSRGRDERDAAMLILIWKEIFDAVIYPHLLAQVDERGHAWAMDRKGRIYLRTSRGKEIQVTPGPDGGKASVQISGRPFEHEDAYHLALVHRSLGKESFKITGGSKKSRRQMWAAARIAGLEVEDYKPDPKAMQILEEMKRNSRIEEVE